MAKEIQSKAQAVRVNVEHDSPMGYVCITTSEKQTSGRYRAVESVCIPNDVIAAVIAAMQSGGDLITLSSDDVRVGDVLTEWRLGFAREGACWSSVGLHGDKRVLELVARGGGLHAVTADRDHVKLTGYQWRVRRLVP